MFSVVIPVYNKLPHLERSINSVLNQSFSNFELIVIDDASTDGSSEKLDKFQDARIRKFRRDIPGAGGYAARNLGIQSARFEWICFLDADDEWDTSYLEEVNKQVQQYPNAQVISCKWETFPVNRRDVIKLDEGVDAGPFTFVDYLYNRGLMWTSAITIQKSLLLQTGLFPIEKCTRGGDLDTWIRCLEKSFQNIYIRKTLAYYYRDSVNRVTDGTVNPPEKFCSLDTLKLIRARAENDNLKRAIDFFIRTSIFSVLGVRAKMGLRINYTLVNEIYPISYRFLTIFKLGAISLKYRLIR